MDSFLSTPVRIANGPVQAELDTGEQETLARALSARHGQLADVRSYVHAHNLPEAEHAVSAEMDAVIELWRKLAPDRS